ncbi:NAD(P)-binding protein [Sparassis crispa]|uniref:NAD(P)-binding protein n=1 Tax=Sparassis crispa TaxID=139825 RepID=A0A401GMY1_9APHY|nr:NAD(P)-binding protein [Sparassis crispa]GBE83552.1 NAD(P)-binding protein [Sparassis crispa]
MPKLIAVTGATGNQGGSVARLLLKYPEQYKVRALTRDPSSSAATALAALGAEVVQADLVLPETIRPALEGCWGVFGVTNFYDPKIKDDPGSEEQQGRNLVDAALAAGVACFVWSTLPSSRKISGGRLVSRIYEGKCQVDEYIRETGLPATFLYTGNFYENMVYRAHMQYDPEADVVEFHQPVVKEDTKLAMLYVEKDLAGVTKAVLDQYEARPELHHEYLYVSNARVSPREIVAAVTKVTGKRAAYVTLATTGVPDRDIMFRLYNEMGMYGGKEIPDENVLALGVELHSVEDFIRERLAPHLGLPVVG